MKSRQQQQVERYTAARRLQAPDQSDLAWKQWGQALVDQYPHQEWPARLQQVPPIYRPLITSRLIRLYGYQIDVTENNDEPSMA